MQSSRRKHDADFKRNAVALSNESGRTVAEVADGLGISAKSLYRWRRELRMHGHIAFPGNGNVTLTDQQRHIKELEKKLIDVAMERDILKKALAIFSKAPK